MIIRFDLGWDIELEFSRSNLESAIFQPKMVDYHKTKSNHIDRALGLKCDHQTWWSTLMFLFLNDSLLVSLLNWRGVVMISCLYSRFYILLKFCPCFFPLKYHQYMNITCDILALGRPNRIRQIYQSNIFLFYLTIWKKCYLKYLLIHYLSKKAQYFMITPGQYLSGNTLSPKLHFHGKWR